MYGNEQGPLRDRWRKPIRWLPRMKALVWAVPRPVFCPVRFRASGCRWSSVRTGRYYDTSLSLATDTPLGTETDAGRSEVEEEQREGQNYQEYETKKEKMQEIGVMEQCGSAFARYTRALATTHSCHAPTIPRRIPAPVHRCGYSSSCQLWEAGPKTQNPRSVLRGFCSP